MLRLSRLPRAHPGVVVRPALGHANPYFLDRARFIDPAHPAAQLGLRNLPAFVCPHFTIRAFPNAILLEPTNFVPPNPLLATALVRARTQSQSNLDTEPRPTSDGNGDNLDATQRRLAVTTAKHLAARGRHSISLLFHTSKKATSKSSVVRRRLCSKMTAAICLVIGRNTDAVDTPKIDHPRKPTPHPPLHLVSLQDGETLVLQDWTYLVVPDLSIYKIPLPNLIQAVRNALPSLIQQAKRIEVSWSAVPNHQPPSPRVNSPLRHSNKVVDKSHSRAHHIRRLRPPFRPSNHQ